MGSIASRLAASLSGLPHDPCDFCQRDLTTKMFTENDEYLMVPPQSSAQVSAEGDSSARDGSSTASLGSASGLAKDSDYWVGGYRKGVVLGRGRLAKVRLCDRAGEQFAMKIFKKRDLKRLRHWDDESESFRSALEAVGTEIAIMKKLRHPHVVRLHHVIDDASCEKLYLVLEFVPGGALLSDARLGPNRWCALDEPRAIALLRDVVTGLAYLHAHGIVHQDLKPDNILLDVGGRAKIADFGVARLLVEPHKSREAAWRAELQREIGDLVCDGASPVGEAGAKVGGGKAGGGDEAAGSVIQSVSPSRTWAVAEVHGSLHRPPPALMLESAEGTPAFRAPETYAAGEHDGRAADVWSLGVTLYVMLFGTLPFPMPVAEAAGSPPHEIGGAPQHAPFDAADLSDISVGACGSSLCGEIGGGGPLCGESVGGGVSTLSDHHQQMIRSEMSMEAAVREQPLRFPHVLRGAPSGASGVASSDDAAGGQLGNPSEGARQLGNPSEGARQLGNPSEGARRVMARMLTKDPGERATLASIATDTWLTAHGLQPLSLPVAAQEVLSATPEEIHRAIAIRAPALDLAGGGSLRPSESVTLPSARASHLSNSTRATERSQGARSQGGTLTAADRARSETWTRSHTQFPFAFPMGPR